MKISTRCQVCKVPMQIDYVPNDFLSATTCANMATCDRCIARKYRGSVSKHEHREPAEQKLPYKDL